jgi:hexokinase
MLAAEFAQRMDMELLLPDMAGHDMGISGCYIGDLLSNVMGKAKTGQIWLTVMTNINVMAVAQLLELSGIVLLEENQPAEGVLERAALEGIPVFRTKESAYQAAIRLHEAELAPR